MSQPGAENDDLDPMVRITKFYVLDKEMNFACIVDLKRTTLYLNGFVRPMSGHGPEQLVHHIPIDKW
jgi:hypothetical protein